MGGRAPQQSEHHYYFPPNRIFLTGSLTRSNPSINFSNETDTQDRIGSQADMEDWGCAAPLFFTLVLPFSFVLSSLQQNSCSVFIIKTKQNEKNNSVHPRYLCLAHSEKLEVLFRIVGGGWERESVLQSMISFAHVARPTTGTSSLQK